MAETGSVLVTGAGSQIGYFLLPQLLSRGYQVSAISRRSRRDNEVGWLQADLGQPPADFSSPAEILFHLAPLPLLPNLLHPEHTPALRRVIAFGSTSRFSKWNSPDPAEQALARTLAEAETKLIESCEQRGMGWTLFRPTLVYGCGLDKNISFIADFIRRFGFFPLVGPGTGQRQPVHAEDLALACLQALEHEQTRGRAYNLSGGNSLSYARMVEEIFLGLGRKPRIFRLPLSLALQLLRPLSRLPRFRHLSPAMLAREEQDLCFDHSMAREDFGFNPRPFGRDSI